MVISSQDWLDAQNSVLGSVLISPELTGKVVSETKASDYSGSQQQVYKAIKSLFIQGKQADPVLICDLLGAAYSPFLLQLMEVTPTAANIDQYIELTKARGRMLRLRAIGESLQTVESMEEAAKLMDAANQAMVTGSRFESLTMEQALEAFYDRHDSQKSPEYLSWPIDGLNGRLFAEAGDLIVLGGYPSDGKSALALQICRHVARSKRVGYFSLETSGNKLFDRFMAGAARVPMDRLKTNSMTEQDWDSVSKSASTMATMPMELIQAAGASVADIKAISQAKQFDVIVVDYLQLVQGRGRDRFSIVTDVSMGLHTMAQTTGIIVIALAQLNRQEKRKDGSVPEPNLSSLRESGQIEQDADIVMMLYRERLEDSIRQLLILKNKEGGLGRMKLDFDGMTQTFSRQASDRYQQTQKAIRAAGKEFPIIHDTEPLPFEEENQCKLAMS